MILKQKLIALMICGLVIQIIGVPLDDGLILTVIGSAVVGLGLILFIYYTRKEKSLKK